MTDQTTQSGNPPWRKPPFKVVVVLPAYNEEENLGELLERIDQVMTDAGQRYEVLVVDDGSKDRTFEIAEQHGRQMPVKVHKHVVNQGLGGTIRDCLTMGAQMCDDRDIVVSMDADNTHTPALIPSMVQMILEGNDVVIASRYQPGSYIRGVPFHREILSIGVRWLFQIVFPIKGVRDYSCGFRAYRVSMLKQAIAKYGDQFVSEAGFQCMVDILLKMRTMNAIFREAPMILRYDLKGGVSKMNVARTVWRTLTLMLKRRFGG